MQKHTNQRETWVEELLDPDSNGYHPKWRSASDPGCKNTTVFVFNREDHTLGNMMAQRVAPHKSVVFSAYKVPNPLNEQFLMRVETDGKTTPKEAVAKCRGDAIKALGRLDISFQTEWNATKVADEKDNKRRDSSFR
jgi:DNA-directed RNA polymerase II subunit RPB11